MPVPDFIRDSLFGRLVYYASGRRYFRYPEELPGYVCPLKYRSDTTAATALSSSPSTRAGSLNGHPSTTKSEEIHTPLPPEESPAAREVLHLHGDTHDVQKELAQIEKEIGGAEGTFNPNIVDWYGPDDPDCPENWSLTKRCFVTFQITWLTFAIYIAPAIWAPGIPDLAEKLNISYVAGNLGITMFVLGYACGPMFLSPLSEIPYFGRAPVYMLTLLIFSILQVPTALAKNLGTIIILRYLAGFIGSPPITTGGASVADMWKPDYRALAMGAWSAGCMGGPVLGPLLGGFAAQAKGWTWTMWILCWLGFGTWVVLFFVMPETSAQAILYRRARRLRKVTGNPNLKTRAEIEMEHLTVSELAKVTLIRPFYLGFREPIVMFWNFYLGMVYAVMYCFIASFDVIFIEHHHFNLGQNGLAFMGIIVGNIIAWLAFLPWAINTLRPKYSQPGFSAEDRLPPAFVGAFLFPISLFWFGWTSQASVHWIVPIIASTVWAASAFYLFQAGINFLADCYPRYVASVLASNDLFRSILGAVFPLFSTAFFHNVGVGQAMSILGAITVAMLPVPFVLYRWGPKIRAMSTYTD